jgi:uncharacterized protein YukE
MKGMIIMSDNEMLMLFAKIRSIAVDISKYNKQLNDTLGTSISKVTGLRATWDSPAAEVTVNDFRSFVTRFSTVYYDKINEFVVFLNGAAQLGEHADKMNTPDAVIIPAPVSDGYQ